MKPLKELKGEIAILAGLHIGDGWLSCWKNSKWGYVQKKWCLNAGNNYEFARNVAKLIRKLGFHAKVYKRSDGYYQLQSYDVVNLIEKFFPQGKASSSATIPTRLKSKKTFTYVLKGIFSCDGSLGRYGYRYYLSFDTASEKLAVEILDALRTLGFKSYMYKATRRKRLPSGITKTLTTYTIRLWSKEEIIKFMHYIGSLNPKHLRILKSLLKIGNNF